MRQVVEQLEPVAEVELLHPLAVDRAEVADEARDHVFEPGGGERREERAWVALAEEAARVRDPEAVGRVVLEPDEVVEVAPVRDHAHRAGRVVGADLVRDRVRDGDDPVGPVRDQAHHALERLLPGLDGLALEAAVGVLDERVALVGDPRHAGQPLDRGADQVHRERRARRDHGVDAFALDDPHGGRDRGRRPGDARVREQQPPAQAPAPWPARGRTLPACAALPRGAAPSARGSARGGRTPASAAAARRPGAATSGRPARARASRSRARAGASPASAGAGRRHRRRAGSTW